MFLHEIKKLRQESGFIRYFKNTGWMLGEQIIRIVSGFLVGIWVARYLGPEQFGIFNYALAYTAIFAGIAKIGLDGIIVREIVKHPESVEIYLGTAFWLKILGAFLVFLLIGLLFKISSNYTLVNTYIFIITLGLVFQSFEVIDFYFQSQVKARVVSICKITQLLISAVFKIYLVLVRADLLWFVVVVFIDSFSLAISYSIAYWLNNKSFFYKYFNFKLAKKLLKDSWPMIFSSLVVMIYMRIDQIMIKEILGEKEVGVYSAAVRLGEAFYFIPVIITTSLFPAILNAKKVSNFLYYERIQNLYDFLVVIGFAIAVITTFFAKPLISFLYGSDFLSSSSVLVIHMWASIFVFLGVASTKWFISENLIFLSFIRTLIGMILNVVLNLIFIPKFNIQGAAFSSLISQFFAAYIFDFFTKETYEMFRMKTRALLFGRFFLKIKKYDKSYL